MSCLICLEEIYAPAPTWQCQQCFVLMHLGCVQAFATSSLAPAQKLLATIIALKPVWNCPHCRHEYAESEYPSQYLCYCGAVKDPEPDPFLPPHSCGGTCGRPRPACPHTCVERCHPGACVPCTQLVDVRCHCGKTVSKQRCGRATESCGQSCQRARECGHACTAVCHGGQCAVCVLPVRAACNCGAQSKMTPCFKRKWSCEAVCGKALACGRHSCAVACHAGPCPPCAHAGVRTCPCGKVTYKPAQLPCDVPVPRCGDTCGKALACGHGGCTLPCHEGPCEPCRAELSAACRCGKTKKTRKCSDPPFLCDKKCTAMRNCGRHPCKRKCCLGPAPASNSSSSSSSGGGGGAGAGAAAAAAAADDENDASQAYCPPCREVCGRKLACGVHSCSALCHAGACQPCPVRVTLTCACGASRVTLPCGAHVGMPPPACRMRCRKPPACHHKSSKAHGCHEGPCPPCTLQCDAPLPRCTHTCPMPCHDGHDGTPAAPCLPCAVPVERACVGGHSRRQQACAAPALWRCDAPCGAPLACSHHSCDKPCHAITAAAPCGECSRACAQPRPAGCTHSCSIGKCHSGPCPPCTVPVPRACSCGGTAVTKPCSQWYPPSDISPATTMIEQQLSCGVKCPRALRCGHACPLTCHAPPCPAPATACTKRLTVRCACGARRQEWTCPQVQATRGITLVVDAGPHVVLPCEAGEGCKVKEKEQVRAVAADGVPTATTTAGAAAAAAQVDAEQENALSAAAALDIKRRRKAEAAARKEAEAAAAKAAAEAAAAVAAAAAKQEQRTWWMMAAAVAVFLLVLLLRLVARALGW